MSRLLFSICIILSFVTGSRAQTGIPEFKDKVMALSADGKLNDLDNTDLQTELNTTMGGTSTVSIKALDKASSVSSEAAATFIVKVDPGTDPESVVELFQFSVEKKSRKIKIAYYVMGKAKDVDLPKIKLKFIKVQDGVYSISPKEPLVAGEYVFVVSRPNIDIMSASSNTRMKGFAFSVK